MKKIKTICMFMFLLCLLLPSIALAADGGPMTTVLGDLVQIAAYAVGITVVGLIGVAARWIAKKYKVSVPATWLTSINGFVDKAIHYAEEWAKNKIAKSETVNGNDKLNTAMSFLLNIVGDDKKLVKMAEEHIKQLIEARLNENRSLNVMMTPINSGDVHDIDVSLLSVSEAGAATLHLTNGGKINIDDLLKRAGYNRAPSSATEVASSQGGFVSTKLMLGLLFVGMILFAFSIVSCAGITKDDAKQIGKNGINCAVGELFERAKEMSPSIEANIKATVDQTTGKVNWDQAKASTSGFKSDVAGCALAMAVDAILRITPGSGFASLQVDRASLVDGYDAIRETQFDGKVFQTK